MRQLKEEFINDIAVVTMADDLTQNDYLEARQYFNNRFIEGGTRYLILDCELLKDPPSIAYGVFCSLNRDFIRAGGRMVIIHISAQVKTIMDRIHVTEQLFLYATQAEAMDALKG